MSELPSQDNEIHNLVLIMNKFGILPSPLNLIASRARQKIIKKLNRVSKIHIDFNFQILFGNLIGDEIWFQNTYILDYAPIYFGKNINVGPDVKLITSWHSHENFTEIRALPITLCDNVWLTMNIIVLPGVTIGENSVIAAGSVVTKSIPSNVMAGGNPCKVIKEIDRKYPWWTEVQIDFGPVKDITVGQKSKLKKALRNISRIGSEYTNLIKILK